MPTYLVSRYLSKKNAPFQIVESGSDVMYQGLVTEQSGAELLETLKRTKAKRLFVNSYGGSSEGAMSVGSYILANNIQVVAVGICYSACANYFFLPSKHRAKTADSILGMHGGFQSYLKQRKALHAALPEPYRTRYYEQIFPREEKKIREEIRLLELAGINPKIIEESAERTYYGETVYIENEPEYFKQSQAAIKKSNFDLWFPEPTDQTYPVPMTIFEKSQVPTEFTKWLRDYIGEAKKANTSQSK